MCAWELDWVSFLRQLSEYRREWVERIDWRGKGKGVVVRMAGYFVPEVPTMESLPTLPRRRKSNIVRPTTPTFLSDPEAPPPTKPVVYSPVPTMRTFRGFGPCSAV